MSFRLQSPLSSRGPESDALLLTNPVVILSGAKRSRRISPAAADHYSLFIVHCSLLLSPPPQRCFQGSPRRRGAAGLPAEGIVLPHPQVAHCASSRVIPGVKQCHSERNEVKSKNLPRRSGSLFIIHYSLLSSPRPQASSPKAPLYKGELPACRLRGSFFPILRWLIVHHLVSSQA